MIEQREVRLLAAEIAAAQLESYAHLMGAPSMISNLESVSESVTAAAPREERRAGAITLMIL